MSAKEDCFKDATRAYEDASGKDLGIDFQQPWRQLGNGTWERASNWWSALNSFWNGNATQVRRPDITIGGKKVFDLKFTRSDGTVDTWGNVPGKGNGNTQLNDYNDINRQNAPDMDNDDPKLDPESCNCRMRGAAPMIVPVPRSQLDPFSLYMMPSPAPGVPVPSVPSLPPIRIPFPGVPFPAWSSRSYKEEVTPADLEPERLLELEVCRFRWAGDGRPDVGLIAEEVRDVVPELYHEQPGFTGIHAGQLPFYLLQLVQKQQKLIGTLSARLATLEAGQRRVEEDPATKPDVEPDDE